MSKFGFREERFLKFAYEYFLRCFIYCTKSKFLDNTIFSDYMVSVYTCSSIIM